jgi:hypothetical protein
LKHTDTVTVRFSATGVRSLSTVRGSICMNRRRTTSPDPAVFICSSDSRYDVLKRILPSVLKFWTDRPYPLYAGMNTAWELPPQVLPVLAPASHWQQEFSAQLGQIPEAYVLVLLDDFLLHTAVDQPRMAHLVRHAITLDLPYLRLVPLGRSLVARLTGRRPTQLSADLEHIPANHPFYCGLQATLWRKQHLLSRLVKQQSIWEFEHQAVPEAVHCAITHSPPIRYRHLVERGRWLPDAPSLLRRAGLPIDLGDRPMWSKLRYGRLCLDQIRWSLLGYSTC